VSTDETDVLDALVAGTMPSRAVSGCGTSDPGIGRAAVAATSESRAPRLAWSSLGYALVDIARAPVRRTRRTLAYGVTGVLLVVGASLGLRELRPAAPTVERTTVWMDTVRRGPMLREVFGQGKLVPVEIRWVAARSNAQVERVLVTPGTAVRADTVLLELANSELELAALEAERQLSQAEAELVNLQATLNAGELAEESVVATLTSELSDAVRRARADEELAKKGFLSELEQGQTLGRAQELGGRLEFEKKRLAALSHGNRAQLEAQKAQIGRLRSIAEFRRREVDGLRMRAGVDGVLSELALEQGQSVAAGALLAKVVRPDRLKAEVRIPETQAKDLQIGQRASVDTRNGVVTGHVVRIDPAAQGGSVRVDVMFDGPLPPGARPDLNVEGTVELERLEDVLFVKRPVLGAPGTTASLFRVGADDSHAERVAVQLGRSSREAVEILSGLREGDRIILSDLSQWDEVDRIRLR
jgi:HlyD family secretion protein